jgi:hypothetical protein
MELRGFISLLIWIAVEQMGWGPTTSKLFPVPRAAWLGRVPPGGITRSFGRDRVRDLLLQQALRASFA